MEAGNVLNKPVFGNPQGSVTSGTFGQITAAIADGGSSDQRPPSTRALRRLGLRFTY